MFNGSNLTMKYKTFSKTLQMIKKHAADKKPPISHRIQHLFNTIKSKEVPKNLELSNQLNKYSKFIHNLLDKNTENKTSLNNSTVNKLKSTAVLGAAGLTIVDSPISSLPDAPKPIDNLPEPPPIPDGLADSLLTQTNALGEPTFASLGLGGNTPVGLVQNCFEYLHVTLGVPWWEAIVIGTIIIRFLMFPLVIIAQRNAAKMNNYMPQMQVLQLKMTEARQMGNHLEMARYSQELMNFMKEKNFNPFKNMLVPLAQMPVFVSFFMGLRQMANVPVDSMRTGGLFWFSDLTIPDQFMALPIITSLTLWATIELGTDSAKLSAQNLQTMKYVLRALPLIILPFTVNFPGAILCYWVASNFISLGQVGFLRIPRVREYFKIDPMIKHNPANLPVKPKGFVEGVKDSWTNIKISKEIEERARVDELQFQRAGKGPLVKTFKYDPTKQAHASRNAISAKKRD
ncbi:mitochondrial inner membrane protein OXA1L [Onthophagus taurus]|uniref:mitochondrial inner membrane protein OXA1L n=1 Tax=Onthophagus taurus TaxID=166361 RepID=UPI000C20576E|nr:mitochondrial inner membrane protein OXA1L [Onthophagus taurus]